MTKTTQSSEVHKFIADLSVVYRKKAEIVTELYDLFLKENSKFTDKFIYGGIGIYLKEELIGGIYVSKQHVSLVFSDGYKLKDTHKVLEGSGKFRRHITVKDIRDIETKKCADYIESLFDLYT